ncbi:uncharacterized protein LOC112569649 isoform X2 [Pomacea canaliculata]|uniref:uncharacterized protein LOC112569649 isoform X2 n=1 Tax=Pomacea canaliculata TaxID=400727 RepID=UPI000D725839|nr:uncharacterized protein LOC112569649 isoform X2 [Pomacea canaliculata]
MGHVTTFYLLSLLFMSAACVHGEQSTCAFTSYKNCTLKITCKIQGALAAEGRSFRLINNVVGKKETLAVLGYVGFYICDPAKGYKCDKEDDDTFFVTTPCIPWENITLSADGEVPVPCTLTSQSRPSESDPETLEKDDCENEETVITGNTNKHINKRSVGAKCHPSSSSKEDFKSQEAMTSQIIGICLGIGFTAIATAIGLIVFFRRRRLRNNDTFPTSPSDPEAPRKSEEEATSFLPKRTETAEKAEE